MEVSFSDSQLAALIGALVGSGIAVVSQGIFYVLTERQRLRDLKLALAKQRLDEFYSPLMTRLLEIEYKLWLDHDVQLSFKSDNTSSAHKSEWDNKLAAEIATLDSEIIDIFRSKRWLAFDSTVVECQKLVRYLETTKLTGTMPEMAVVQEWGDVTHLKDLHRDVREHHICLMSELGIEKCGTVPLIPDQAGGFRVQGEMPLEKYHASLELRSSGKQTTAANPGNPDDGTTEI